MIVKPTSDYSALTTARPMTAKVNTEAQYKTHRLDSDVRALEKQQAEVRMSKMMLQSKIRYLSSSSEGNDRAKANDEIIKLIKEKKVTTEDVKGIGVDLSL